MQTGKFSFEDVPVGTAAHSRLIGKLADAAGEGKEVFYEEIVKSESKTSEGPYRSYHGTHTMKFHNREVICRGHILP